MADVSQAAWQSYETGGQPGVDAAVSIEKITKGKIKVAAWVVGDTAKAERKARAAAHRVTRSGTDG